MLELTIDSISMELLLLIDKFLSFHIYNSNYKYN